MGMFGQNRNKGAIRRVKLMGMRTAQETLILTTVNFTVYSFWIEYENGATETLEVSPKNPNDKFGKEKKLFDKLMAYANEEPPENTNSSPVADSSILDELKKLKELLDAEVIPQDLYEEKRAELLKKLSNARDVSARSKNITISRLNERPFGEIKTLVYIDGKKLDADLDNPISLLLSEGEHTVYFQRAALRSKKLKITVSPSKQYRIDVTPKNFSIDVNVREKEYLP